MEIIALILIILFVIVMQGWIFNKFVPLRLEYECRFSVTGAHEGDNIFLVETVYNRKILPVPWLKVDIHSSRWLDFAGFHSVVTQDNRRVTSSFYLRGYQRTIRRWKLKCLKRGVFETQNITLTWGDLLGTRINSQPLQVNACLVVYPGIINLDEYFIPINRVQGDTVVKRWIIDDPFIVAGAREYVPGDPMNKIHWNATARTGQLMTRKNEFTSRNSLAVVLNIQSIEFEYKDVVDRSMIELGIKVAATILDSAMRIGSPVRLATNGIIKEGGRNVILTESASGREHIKSLLEILARLELFNVREFEDFLDAIYPGFSSEDVVIITCYLSERICETIRALNNRGNTTKVVLLDQYVNTAALPHDIDIYILSGKGGAVG